MAEESQRENLQTLDFRDESTGPRAFDLGISFTSFTSRILQQHYVGFLLPSFNGQM